MIARTSGVRARVGTCVGLPITSLPLPLHQRLKDPKSPSPLRASSTLLLRTNLVSSALGPSADGGGDLPESGYGGDDSIPGEGSNSPVSSSASTTGCNGSNDVTAGPSAATTGTRSDGEAEGLDGSPLTLGSAVLERMAKLRALDQYCELMLEVAVAAAVRQRTQVSAGTTGGADSAAVAGDDSALLLRGALLIARHRYPSLDERKVYGTLDEMARRVGALLPAEMEQRYPLRVVAAINRVMYHDFGFRGNEEDYYNADNSCINRVVERRVGIPITLSLVYSEVARRVGLPMRGLNLPGHFMLQPVRPSLKRRGQQQPNALGGVGSGSSSGAGGEKDVAVPAAAGSSGSAEVADSPQAGEGTRGNNGEEEEDEAGPLEVLVDAFRSGEVCYAAEAEERISQLLGSPVRIDPLALQESRPLPPRMFLLRMLGNLRSIYLSTQQLDALLDVLKLMRATLKEGGGEGAEGAARSPAITAAGAEDETSASSFAAPAASLARDEGLCYFALRRYPECLEALREYLLLTAESGPSPEEAKTVSAVMEEARRRMMQQN